MHIEEFKPDVSYESSEKELSNEISMLHREINKLGIPVILVFEGWYDSYIAEIINRQIIPLDPRGYDFYFTKTPTHSEIQIPFMVRFMKKIPPKGKISIFDRSWYIRGLLEYMPLYEFRKKCLADYTDPKNKKLTVYDTIKQADSAGFSENYDLYQKPAFLSLVHQIKSFEKNCVKDGYIFIKIYFGMKQEDRKKIKTKIKNSIYDLDKMRKSKENMYYEDLDIFKKLLTETDTEYAPWNVVFVKDEINLSVIQTMKIISKRLKEAIKQIQETQESKSRLFEESVDLNSESSKPISTSATYFPILDSVDLSKVYSKKKYQKKLEKEQKKLYRLHHLMHLYKIPVICVFEGWDASGKGGCIKRTTRAMNPRLYRVVPIGAPSPDELKYHYIHRFLDGIPPCGKMTIYDRSWYGRVLVERIEHFATKDEWMRAFEEINEFEKMMTSSGILVLKFWLHIDEQKQLRRFMERKTNPKKQWKLTEEDWRNHEKWNEYYAAAEEMIEKTDTKDAPWIIVESNDQKYARIKVLKTIRKALLKELKNQSDEEKKNRE